MTTFDKLDKWAEKRGVARHTKVSSRHWYRDTKQRPNSNDYVKQGLHPSGAQLGPEDKTCNDCGYLTSEVFSSWSRCGKHGAIGNPPGNCVRSWRACDAFIDTLPDAEARIVVTSWANRVGPDAADVQLDFLVWRAGLAVSHVLHFVGLVEGFWTPLLEPPPDKYFAKPRDDATRSVGVLGERRAGAKACDLRSWMRVMVVRVELQDAQRYVRQLRG